MNKPETLEDAIREFSIKLTVPATMTGKVPENLYDLENELQENIIEIMKWNLPLTNNELIEISEELGSQGKVELYRRIVAKQLDKLKSV